MRLLRIGFPLLGLIASAATIHAVESDREKAEPGLAARDAANFAVRIDQILVKRWAELGVNPAPLADDGEFLRRVSLDLIGKIPTAGEARDFLDDPSPDKRRRLVERLLDSPAYTTRATEVWRRVFLPEADTENQAIQVAGSFEAWLRRKVVEEAGYDRIVREILTTKLEDQTPGMAASRAIPSPTAYYTAKEGKPENLAAGSARVFLGIRLECAQCHNHPFAPWKRDQFWSFAAFFAGVPSVNDEERISLPREGAPKRELTIPGTKKVVSATNLDGSAPVWRPRADTREILADWITAPENPYFARSIVNRFWARFFGSGLVEPVDDMPEDTAPEFRPLLDELAEEFKSHGYDIKYLIRIITSTRAYHLSSAGTASDTSSFSSMPVRGLSASQLFESLARSTGVDSQEARSRFFELFARLDERETEIQTSILQSLTMMNGRYLAEATNPETGELLGAIAKAPFLDTAGKVESLFLATLTRRPRPDELAALVSYIDRRGNAEDRTMALSDILWAILNGPEFPLNH